MRARLLVGLFFIVGIISFGIPAHAAVVDSQLDDSAQAIQPPLTDYYTGIYTHLLVPNYLAVGYVPPHDLSFSGVRFRINTSGGGNYHCPEGALMQYSGTSSPATWDSGVNYAGIIPVSTTTPDTDGNCDYITTDHWGNIAPISVSPFSYYVFFMAVPTSGIDNWVSMSGKQFASSTPVSLLGYRPATDNRYVWGTSGLDAPYFEFFDTAPPPVTPPTPPDPCVATNTCASNVMFLPGIEGSRLYEDMPCVSGVCETKLWEPSGDTLALRLSHNADGTSANTDIYEKKNGIIDNAYIPVKGNIYKSFIEQMNGLVTAKTIKEWEAIPYDWRLSPEQILTSGAQIAPDKISYLVATSSPYIIQELKRLASSSKTGKVTIIAHSNGGLVTKALIEKLGPEATNLVDKIIFVAVPQAGTPLAIGALLHGYGQGLPVALFPYALSDSAARTLSANMPMTYNLLPSAAYFTQVDTPVVTFTNESFLAPFRSRYGDVIHSRERLHTFLVDPWRLASSTTEGLNYPSVGNEPLLNQAETLHTDLDAWTPPSGITLYEIAGWGEKTLAGIDYYQGVTISCDQIMGVIYRCTRTPKIDYHPRIVLDGDGTVVTPSALWTPGANRYWVDLGKYNNQHTLSAPFGRQHGDILEVGELRTFLQNIITNNDANLPQYISTSTPMNPNQDTELHFTLHSPLTLNLYDDQGRHTGVSTTTGELEENIPGSRYMKFGEVQFISAPSSIHTQLIMNGFATGSFTLDAEETNGGTVVASTTFAGIPSAATAVVKMDVPSGGLANMGVLTVDESGNGHSDIILQPKAGNTVLLDITPPEIQVTFSTTTKSIMFVGSDDSGTTTMTTSTIYSTFKKNQKEKERENHGIATTTVTARDDAGNTTVLTYTKPSSDSDERRKNIALTSVSYNGIKSDLSKTSLRYEWDTDKKGRYTMFSAQLKTASSTVEAQYQSKKNLTVITTLSRRSGDNEDDDETDSHAIQNKFPGLVIPRMQTENGSVRIIY